MIGDTPWDIEAARLTGLRAIGFRSGGFADADPAGAFALFDGAPDLLDRFSDTRFRAPCRNCLRPARRWSRGTELTAKAVLPHEHSLPVRLLEHVADLGDQPQLRILCGWRSRSG